MFPALFTSTSNFPPCDKAASKISLRSFSTVMSPAFAIQFSPKDSARDNSVFLRLPQMVTRAPFSTNLFAIPAPMPEPPPVIRTDNFSVSFNLSSSAPKGGSPQKF